MKSKIKNTKNRKQAGQARALALGSCSGLWALKSPDGKLVWQTATDFDNIRWTGAEDAVWSHGGYSAVLNHEGEEWGARFWKRWDESIADAKKRGWSFVRVTLSEDCPNHVISNPHENLRQP